MGQFAEKPRGWPRWADCAATDLSFELRRARGTLASGMRRGTKGAMERRGRRRCSRQATQPPGGSRPSGSAAPRDVRPQNGVTRVARTSPGLMAVRRRRLLLVRRSGGPRTSVPLPHKELAHHRGHGVVVALVGEGRDPFLEFCLVPEKPAVRVEVFAETSAMRIRADATGSQGDSDLAIGRA